MFKNLSPGAIGVSAALPEAVRLAKAYGWGGVDVSMGEIERMAAETSLSAVKDLLGSAGVRPGGFGLPMDWRAAEPAYKEGLQTLARFAALGAAIDCRRVTMWIPPASDALPFEENFRFHVERFRPIAAILADHGCRLGLEFIGPKTLRVGKKYEFIWTMDGMRELCSEIGENCGLLLDAWHWYTSHGTLADLSRLTNRDVVYVHVNDAPEGVDIDAQIDSVRRLPGETGVIDLVGFFRALSAMGYDGPVTPEPFSQKVREMGPEDAVRATAEALAGPWTAAGL